LGIAGVSGIEAKIVLTGMAIHSALLLAAAAR
jgi:hypothetical protein